MKKLSFCVAFYAAMLASAYAWNDADCRRACQKTARDVAACISPSGQNCAQYKGAKPATAGKVDSFSRAYNAQHGTPAQRGVR